MGSLQRYKKSGGFYQLLSLIETFGPQKKEKFLEMIEAESPAWARVLRQKMITVERIFSWPEQVVVEIFKNLPPKTMAYALHGLNDEQKAKIMIFFSASEKRKLDDLMAESPKPEQIASVMVKLVEQCRKMLKDRELHVDKFDETLAIPEGIESKIEEMAAHDTFRAMSTPSAATSAKTVTSSKTEKTVAAPDVALTGDVLLLQKKLAQLLKENRSLKDELTLVKDKLEQIRKIGKIA